MGMFREVLWSGACVIGYDVMMFVCRVTFDEGIRHTSYVTTLAVVSYVATTSKF